MSRRSVLLLSVVGVLAVALLVGVRWASTVRGQDPYQDDARPMTWEGHSPIYGGDGDRIGWIAQTGEGIIQVPLPSSFTADPLNPSAIGVSVVYSDGGKPIGILGPTGFQRGALRDGELDPAVRQQIIEVAVQNVSYTTIPTNSSVP